MMTSSEQHEVHSGHVSERQRPCYPTRLLQLEGRQPGADFPHRVSFEDMAKQAGCAMLLVPRFARDRFRHRTGLDFER